ncbi:MAG: hypothetical protein H6740_15615 [Alphaproteobacteria bacterium]|nr:hypothetical protein [Alphaproteobacteria bacterium]
MSAPHAYDLDDERVISFSRVAVLRAAWMPTEATLQGLGVLTVTTAAFPLAFAAYHGTQALSAGVELMSWMQVVMLPATLAGLLLLVGEGLRRLDPRVRAPAILLAGAVLPLFPLGTLLGVALLSQLLSQGGRTVLSPAYAHIIAGSPEAQAPRSRVAMAVGALSVPASLASAGLIAWMA